MGTYNWDPVVELEHPEAFQQALLRFIDVKKMKTFRYVYLGGAFTETDQEKSLWFLTEGRRMRVCRYPSSFFFENLSQKIHLCTVPSHRP